MRLWINQVLLQVAFNMSNYTALLILADRTHSPFVQAQLYAALTLPAFIFGFVAGPVVDMVDRRKLMIISDVLLIVFFFLYIFSHSSLILIMTIAFLTSSVARFFIPAEAATIPRIVSEEILEEANMFFIFTLMGSVLLGYALAGPIIQFFGGLGTIGEIAPFLLSSLFLIFGFISLLSFKKVESIEIKLPKGTIFKKTFSLFRETTVEIKDNKGIWVPILLLVFVEFTVGTLSILILEYVDRYLFLPITSVSYILMLPLIFGLITGVLLLSSIEKRYGRKKIIWIACLGVGILFFSLGISPLISGMQITRIIAVFSSFFAGLSVVFIAVQSRTILQLNAKKEMHGRIFSFLDIMIAFITPVPVLILGFLADKLSILWILSFIGILTALIVILSFELSKE